MNQLAPNLYELPLGGVNVFLIDGADGVTLIDTGAAGSAEMILAAVGGLGKSAADVRHIVVTHCHADHAGSLAVLQQRTGATAVMHPIDADMVATGQAMRTNVPAPGLLNRLLFRLFIQNAPTTVDATAVDQTVTDGETLDVAGGLRVIHAPGHSVGQIALLWPQHGGVLFAADAAGNLPWLRPSINYEAINTGMATLHKLAQLDFEIACFGHGRAIRRGAGVRFRRKWG